jgi:hypothetical protein
MKLRDLFVVRLSIICKSTHIVSDELLRKRDCRIYQFRTEANVQISPRNAVPLKVTAVAPVKPLPVIVTDVPAGPEVGVNEETVGAGAFPGVGMGSGVAAAP